MIRLYSTVHGLVLESAGSLFTPARPFDLDTLFQSAEPFEFIRAALLDASPAPAEVRRILSAAAPFDASPLHAPIQSQEVWAAGVTYLRSKSARMAESKEAGGGTFYDKVYAADRPELFFKATPHRVAAPGTAVRIRSDSRWNVPEPELTLAVSAHGRVFGCTIGNDMSSRDIEGENPLYLPQAKVYDRSAALGPCLLVADNLPGPDVAIALEIRRGGAAVFAGTTSIGQIKRPLPSLADWLFRENRFPHGAYLMTGTGIVPPDTFTLALGDEIRITIDPIGTLLNFVG